MFSFLSNIYTLILLLSNTKRYTRQIPARSKGQTEALIRCFNPEADYRYLSLPIIVTTCPDLEPSTRDSVLFT
jgi:hypothetical protein